MRAEMWLAIAYLLSIAAAVGVFATLIAKRVTCQVPEPFYTKDGLSRSQVKSGLCILTAVLLVYALPAYLFGGMYFSTNAEHELLDIFSALGLAGSLCCLWILLVFAGSYMIGLAFTLRGIFLAAIAAIFFLCGSALTLYVGLIMTLWTMMKD